MSINTDQAVKYWPLIVYGIVLVSSATAGQLQIESNKEAIKEIRSKQSAIQQLKLDQAVTTLKIENIEKNTEEIKQLIKELKK